MSWMAAMASFVASLGRRIGLGDRTPRIVKRVGVECPHGRGSVEVDLLMDETGKPRAVLRCSAHEACPPTCDQSCRLCAASVLSPARAVLVFPAAGPFEDVD